MGLNQQRYAIRVPEGVLYPLDRQYQVEVDGDGTPMTHVKGGWWLAERPATVITVREATRHVPVGYTLRDLDAASTRFPRTLTVEEFEERSDSRERDLIDSLYVAVTEPKEGDVTVLEGPWRILDGEYTPPEDGLHWVPSLPTELTKRPEYHHLFPGYLTGFRRHLADLLGRQPRVAQAFAESSGAPNGISLTLKLPYDEPRYEMVPARTASGGISRRKEKRQVLVSRRHVLLVPDCITGDTRAEAVQKWHEETARFLAIVEGMGVAACSACDGHGYVNADTVPEE